MRRASRLPVLTGIGHEINVTITDLAAHTYQKTPTATAQFIVTLVKDYIDKLDALFTDLCELTENVLVAEKQKLKDTALGLQGSTRDYLQAHQEKLITLSEAIKRQPVTLLKDKAKMLRQQREFLSKMIQQRFHNEREALKHHQKFIDAVDPINTVKRGFSIVRAPSGKVVKSIAHLKPQEKLLTEVLDGIIESEVRSTQRKRG